MITVGKWRWPLSLFVMFLVAAGVMRSGLVSLRYTGDLRMAYTGDPRLLEAELSMFRTQPVVEAAHERVPANPEELLIRVQSRGPSEVVRQLTVAAEACVTRSFSKQKAALEQNAAIIRKNIADNETRIQSLKTAKVAQATTPRSSVNRAAVTAQIQDLQARRRLLIDRYPTHTDIPVLAKRIQDLQAQIRKPAGQPGRDNTELNRQINEALYRQSYFSRQLADIEKIRTALKPEWKIVQPAQKPRWPIGAQGWPTGVAIMAGVFAVCLFLFRSSPRVVDAPATSDVWRPETETTEKSSDVRRPTSEIDLGTKVEELSDVGRRTSDVSIELEVLKPDLPADPLTEKAAGLYAKWVEVAAILYTPAEEPPQGVLKQVAPLLQESSDFLPEGHEVLARYLARSVEPGNLAAHVARTVLMTLSGAREAGVTPEHQLAMALAALFHDLAMVARPPAVQGEIGSEVGRLSATVLRRVPGLPLALVMMVEEILIGMDEFKMKTWQNAATSSNLEPLSKVLREIDRFEKVLQKQKTRLEKRVANQ